MTKPLKSSYPLGHLLNPATVYVPACATNVQTTFARIRAELAARASGTRSTGPMIANALKQGVINGNGKNEGDDVW